MPRLLSVSGHMILMEIFNYRLGARTKNKFVRAKYLELQVNRFEDGIYLPKVSHGYWRIPDGVIAEDVVVEITHLVRSDLVVSVFDENGWRAWDDGNRRMDAESQSVVTNAPGSIYILDLSKRELTRHEFSVVAIDDIVHVRKGRCSSIKALPGKLTSDSFKVPKSSFFW